jgi:hypothetical protein
MSPEMRVATDATRVLAKVRHRLIKRGAVVELRQFDGLSASEMDLLVRLELGL